MGRDALWTEDGDDQAGRHGDHHRDQEELDRDWNRDCNQREGGDGGRNGFRDGDQDRCDGAGYGDRAEGEEQERYG